MATRFRFFGAASETGTIGAATTAADVAFRNVRLPVMQIPSRSLVVWGRGYCSSPHDTGARMGAEGIVHPFQ